MTARLGLSLAIGSGLALLCFALVDATARRVGRDEGRTEACVAVCAPQDGRWSDEAGTCECATWTTVVMP